MRLRRRRDGAGLGCHTFGADGLCAGDQNGGDACGYLNRGRASDYLGVGNRAAGDSGVDDLARDLLHRRLRGRRGAGAGNLRWCRCGSWCRR